VQGQVVPAEASVFSEVTGLRVDLCEEVPDRLNVVLIRQRGRRIGPAGKAVARIGSGEPVLVILLQITEKVDPITGVRSRSRQIIFPRFHQWEAVTSLLETTSAEGGG